LLVASDEVKAVANRLSAAGGKPGKAVTPAQVILAWSQVGGHSVIPKSVTASRIRENFEEVEIEEQDVKALDALGDPYKRFNIPINCEFSSFNYAKRCVLTRKRFTEMGHQRLQRARGEACEAPDRSEVVIRK
jgi:hypothetical protein